MVKFAIFKIGSHQYKVSENDKIRVQKLDVEPGKKTTFKEILLKNSDGKVEVGMPVVGNSSVEARVISHGREKKKIVFRYKPKTRQRTKRGHRQHYTELEITKIT